MHGKGRDRHDQGSHHESEGHGNATASARQAAGQFSQRLESLRSQAQFVSHFFWKFQKNSQFFPENLAFFIQSRLFCGSLSLDLPDIDFVDSSFL